MSYEFKCGDTSSYLHIIIKLLNSSACGIVCLCYYSACGDIIFLEVSFSAHAKTLYLIRAKLVNSLLRLWDRK